ncbi:copper chaperone PCu(A)C [Sphingobium nicotianae]|uniref:Copper chaperone PCu(A)C n=1 Tax=Sphingobium nicotianae TaxID=2782607 RepID=A0A9X1D818_9SPHN|nr:copper chaperone PCu(A)C [Sphingobium nicotianae]MBT2185777.1 copper chaperone PCu(A)C [Sphingobium nicotianae]
MRRACLSIAAMATLLIMTGCSGPPPLYVDGGYVRLNANPQAPSAAYFTIHGGGDPVVLRGVTTDEAVRLEIHESMTQGGMASMKPVDSVDIPAGKTVKFAPGGKHIMLWGVNAQTVADGKISFTFIFSNGDRILADAVVQKPDGSAANAAAGNAAAGDHMENMANMAH